MRRMTCSFLKKTLRESSSTASIIRVAMLCIARRVDQIMFSYGVSGLRASWREDGRGGYCVCVLGKT